MLDGQNLCSAFSNGHCDGIPNGPEDRKGTAETRRHRGFLIGSFLHVPLLAGPAVSHAVARGNSRLLAYRGRERLRVAGHLQHEPASV